MISIIIPAINEAENLKKLLPEIRKAAVGETIEILVADGGSSDETEAVVQNSKARFISSPRKGRAVQMNYGAAEAQGDVLYFLHADTRPPRGFISDINRSLAEGYPAGCYRLAFDSDHPALTWFCWFTRFDLDIFRFGDQSLYVKRELFQHIGGFDEQLDVMEDQEIVRSLKKEAPFRIQHKAVVTSARKYREIGIFKLQWFFTIIVVLYYLGAGQNVIRHFYDSFILGRAY